MQKVKISAVSYLNTLPFVYGLKHYKGVPDAMDISWDIPSVCAQKLLSGEADLGLVPIAIIPKLPHAEIVSDYCLGADGKVETVLLLGDVPKEEMQLIELDYQSRTSVQLVQVLAREFWQISPKWEKAEVGFETKIEHGNGAVVIGDRAFALAQDYAYKYDLANEWKTFTKLPFVFAAWVANKRLSSSFIEIFNAALWHGLLHIEDVIADFQTKNPHSKIDIRKYLTLDIQFQLDDPKRMAMDKFWQLAEQNELDTSKLIQLND